MTARRRAPLAFVAWAAGDSRPRSLAGALGGDTRTFYDLGIVRRPLVPLRYAVSALRTCAYLAARRPRVLVVQCPPAPLAIIAWAYGRLAGAAVMLDAHPAAFGDGSRSAAAAMRALLEWLAPRTRACLVATSELARLVESWGGRALVVHEPPPYWPAPEAAVDRDTARPRVLFVSTLAPGEPLGEVLEAARLLPEVEFGITGDVRRLARGVRAAAPPNVRWLGYLPGRRYAAALADSTVVLTLDERDQSVPRSAYEAIYARRPLVTTDRPRMRELFPHAVHVENRGRPIAEGLRRCLDSAGQDPDRAAAALELQRERWAGHLAALRAVIQGSRTAGS